MKPFYIFALAALSLTGSASATQLVRVADVIPQPLAQYYSVSVEGTSPDGQWILLLIGGGRYHPAAIDTVGLWIIDANGNNLTKVLTGPDFAGLYRSDVSLQLGGSWGSDSRSVYVTSRGGPISPELDDVNDPIVLWRVMDFVPTVGVTDNPTQLPNQLKLTTRGNPVLGRVKATLVLPTSTVVSIRLADVTGRNVRTVVDQVRYSVGRHDIDFPSPEAPGAYFLQVYAGGETTTNKVVVLR